jgi:hypothetical protein
MPAKPKMLGATKVFFLVLATIIGNGLKGGVCSSNVFEAIV